MATSGTTGFSMVARDIITAAMRKLQVLDATQAPKAKEAENGLRALELMLKSWTASDHLWIRTWGEVTLIADQVAYSLPTARRIDSARRKTNGIETPLVIYSRSDYDDIPNKTAPGAPVAVYFDPQRASRTLYVWPAPSASVAANTKVATTYRRVIEDVGTLDEEIDAPQEWLEAIIYNLAVRLAPDFGVGAMNPDFRDVQATAAALLMALKGQDEDEESIFFGVSQR